MNEVQPIKNKRDIDRIKSALSSNPRDLLLFTVGINTALRISDILSLRFQDISDSHIELVENKTGKRKRIKINAAIRHAMRELAPKDARPSDYLFPSRKGTKPIGRSQAWRVLSKAAEDAGIITPFGTHSLRKTAGFFAYKNGTDLSILMRLFNHSSQRETLRYIGIEQEDVDEVYMDLNL